VTHEGGCLCGAVRYAAHGALRDILVCHCVECRRWTGRAWAVTASKDDDFELLADDDLVWIPSPRSSTGASRGFCARCGSSLFFRAPGRGRTGIGAGTLDEPDGLRVAGHIWVEQASDWEPPPVGVPAYPGGYPDDAPPLRWG